MMLCWPELPNLLEEVHPEVEVVVVVVDSEVVLQEVME